MFNDCIPNVRRCLSPFHKYGGYTTRTLIINTVWDNISEKIIESCIRKSSFKYSIVN